LRDQAEALRFDAEGAVELAVEVLEADPAGQFDEFGVREVILEAGEELLIDVLVAARDLGLKVLQIKRCELKERRFRAQSKPF